MTAPTQPPDPRVPMTRAEKIKALDEAMIPTGLREMARERFATVLVDVLAPDARVLVEELGGREGDKPVAPSFPVEWRFVLSVLDDIMPGWANGYMASGAIRAIAEERNACRAQQRENAETIQALRERVETAEAANTELDNARKSAEQSARDLRENNATLRAELDAIKGAQEPWATVTPSNDGWSFKQYKYTKPTDAPFNLYRHPAPPHNPFAAFIDALKADRDMQWYYHCNVAMAACDKGVPHDQANAAAFLFMERLLGEYTPLHAIPEYTPAPALPVVGACVVKDGPFGLLTWLIGSDQHEKERAAAAYAKMQGGKAYRMYRDVTPLSTEGGK